MKLTITQLRKIIKEEVAKSLLEENVPSAPIDTFEGFMSLQPGDSITIDGSPATVVAFSDFNLMLTYVSGASKTRKTLDVRYAMPDDETGESAEIEVVWVGPGTALSGTGRSRSSRPLPPVYD
jgi:hypothetical protein